jgi:serine/threonine protein kinase
MSLHSINPMNETVAEHSCPQHVWNYLRERLCGDSVVEVLSTTPAKSAQQIVLILRLQFHEGVIACHHPEPWRSALIRGNNHLVIRIWKAASRWWNLNHIEENQVQNELLAIARHEIWGYREASKVFNSNSQSSIRIPRVLHFEDVIQDGEIPWAIMEYVGPNSTLFQEGNGDMDDVWETSMIKIRMEYGFLEPHPRWGRVPVRDALEYATQILHSVIVPMHKYYQRNSASTITGKTLTAYDYDSMLQLCKMKYQTILANASCQNEWNELHSAIKRLQQIHESLECRWIAGTVPRPMGLVLVHMDLQPQNILFRKTQQNSEHRSTVVSVLDWEETAWADPRFELVLLCRKVCADREQANHIWNMYQKSMGDSVGIGNIQPWLELETVHSLTALLLQATANGGRSPWEAQKDLFGKIEREFQRFKQHHASLELAIASSVDHFPLHSM